MAEDAAPAFATASIEADGNGQIVRLPEAFRLQGREVRVSRSGDGLMLEPIRPPMSAAEIRAILDELARNRDIPFMENGREQPAMPDDDAPRFVAPPSIEQMRAGLARLERYRDVPFMENGREQPPMPDDDDLPSFDA